VVRQGQRRQYQARPVVVHPQTKHERNPLRPVHPQPPRSQPTCGEGPHAEDGDNCQDGRQKVPIGISNCLWWGYYGVRVVQQEQVQGVEEPQDRLYRSAPGIPPIA
jgi:hypothetical protein